VSNAIPERPTFGTLYLVPTPLDFGCPSDAQPPQPIALWLPMQTISAAAGISHWITENAKSTRAFLKRVDAAQALTTPIQEQHIAELPRQAHKKGDHADLPTFAESARALLAPATSGHNIGLVSEAGMPAIADPGSSVVRAAHAMGLNVAPLTGPISLMLALAASGLNGQNFAFVGYVPAHGEERIKRLKAMEAQVHKTGQTLICIETPYRNPALLQAMLQCLQPQTRVALSCGLHLPQPVSRSASVGQWREQALMQGLPLSLPTVFMMGR
jgi:16S rRNA (cytidine1402-2'-O)-methyltransferase